MRYIINIDPITNLLSDKNFFFGTGFMGAEFSTKKELLQLLSKHATIKKDGVYYWREYIKLSFFSCFYYFLYLKKKVIDRPKENGIVNLFTTCLAAKKDPVFTVFISIFVLPDGWMRMKMSLNL